MMAIQSSQEKIIQSALHLFETYGYSRVTVDQIVKESGTSKGAFYHHFKSKDELLYRIHDVCISLVIEKGQEACQKYAVPTERLFEMIRSYVLLFDSYRTHVAVINEEILYLPSEYFEKIEEKRNRYEEMFFKVIENGIQTGEFRKDLVVPITTRAILGMFNWVYKWYKCKENYSLEEIAAIFNDFILRSVLSEENKFNSEAKNKLLT
jgi:TetR/AcrR family transcriptional regulator, cholesterol catabolism regulator